jgi:uncharacterized protein
VSQRVGLISDTHGLLRPEAVRALQGSDRIIHAGDIGEEEVLAALRRIAPVTAVRGNVDREAWTAGLLRTETVQIEEVWVLVVHDLDALEFATDAAGIRVVVSGHSHRPSIQERKGVLFVNPGSAGPRRFRLPVSLALLDVRGAAVQVETVILEV